MRSVNVRFLKMLTQDTRTDIKIMNEMYIKYVLIDVNHYQQYDSYYQQYTQHSSPARELNFVLFLSFVSTDESLKQDNWKY